MTDPKPCRPRGECCSLCGAPATHKVGEEILWDDPVPDRHNLTAYVCCNHFRLILGPATGCGEPTTEQRSLESLRHENVEVPADSHPPQTRRVR